MTNLIFEQIKWMYDLNKFGIKLDLENILKLCNALGNPQNSFKSIHIAGTNGKGSTSKMIYSILREAKHSCGLYTSPHLVKFNERIIADDLEITDPELSTLIDKIKVILEDRKLDATFFEFTTALAFMHFKEKKVEYAIIETGLGGRLDATNIVNPVLTLITSIGTDHTEYLGNDKKQIILEKLGIAKKGIQMIVNLKEDALVKIAKNYCEEKKVPFALLDKTILPPKVKLLGKHQIENAILAIQATKKIINVDNTIISSALGNVTWSGRFEIISKRPLVIVDCAHNLEGFGACMNTLETIEYKTLIPIIGFSDDKQIDSMLNLLKKKTNKIIATQSEFKPLKYRLLEDYAKKKEFEILGSLEKPMDAVKKGLQEMNEKDCLLITGSMYMIGLIYSSLPDLIQNTPK